MLPALPADFTRDDIERLLPPGVSPAGLGAVLFTMVEERELVRSSDPHDGKPAVYRKG